LEQNETVLKVRAAVSTGASGTTVVLLGDSGSLVYAEDLWEYKAEGTVVEVAPAFGQYGTRVTISGSSLRAHGNRVDQVTFGGVAQDIANETDSSVSVVVTAGRAQVGDVVLTADSEATVTLVDGFEYLAVTNVSEVSPNSGQIGTEVTISGEGLLGGGGSIDSVTLGGVEVGAITSQNDDTVKVVVARSIAAENVDVVITANTGAQATAAGEWSYLAEGNITDVSPTSGQYGTFVTIRGTNLLGGGSGLDFVSIAGGGSPSESSNNTRVRVVITHNVVGRGDIIFVANSGAIVTLEDGFETIDTGVIRIVSPPRGQFGTVVAIHGTNLFGGGSSLKSITVGGVQPLELLNSTNTFIKVRAAASNELGVGDIHLISNTLAEVTLQNGWTYDVPSNITQICV